MFELCVGTVYNIAWSSLGLAADLAFIKTVMSA